MGPPRTPEQTRALETPPHRLRVVAAPGILRSTTAPWRRRRILIFFLLDRREMSLRFFAKSQHFACLGRVSLPEQAEIVGKEYEGKK